MWHHRAGCYPGSWLLGTSSKATEASVDNRQLKSDSMPEPDPKKIKPFATPERLGQWLRANHAVEDELWIKVHKAKSKNPSVTWTEIVIEALCWGWIDGIKKSLDDDSYLPRITPRRTRSEWSKRNREHAERLINEGRMQAAGMAQVRSAQADGRWENAYAPASEMVVPEDFLAALAKKKRAPRSRL